MNVSKTVSDILLNSYQIAKLKNNEYITPEHFLLAALDVDIFKSAIEKCNGDIESIRSSLEEYINNYLDESKDNNPIESYGLNAIIISAAKQCEYSGKDEIEIEHVISSIYDLEDSYARYFLEEEGIEKGELLYYLCHDIINDSEDKVTNKKNSLLDKYAINLTEEAKNNKLDPLIGREDVLERTIQILCRRNKNNPVHIGEPGVGKTAITYGLAQMIANGNVPEKLKEANVFSLDLGAILSGTKYRGDFEERIKGILEECNDYDNPIIYIDEIHNLVGAGGINGNSLDAANLLKPYLLQRKIKVIGSTTYEEYKKYFEKDKALLRRFQTIEVKEPTVKESIKIINGLKDKYENYHNVKYTNRAIDKAVILSNKYINNKFLPDKAIDIIDEAGAYINSHNIASEKIVDENTIEKIMSKVCLIPKETIESNDVELLKNLESNLKEKIFGQNEAIAEITRCIKMAKSGLNDEDKPIASMLFVGPTGVGKTELAKNLAKILNIDFVRFDMSEYGEKHAASKLIGAPPGYVGYEEGGLLTDTIRKKPNCVLLLDEVEKAHIDILNVLLQVMDYATLTDNQGRKIDFRNVILIMTSNAGAKNIGKDLIGFGKRRINDEAINEEVKRIFSPEFRNRLDKVIVFNHINNEIGRNIVLKELKEFKSKLLMKNIVVDFTDSVIDEILKSSISEEYGGREIQRFINSQIKTILVDEILFGNLKNGGKVTIDYKDNRFIMV